ncbi:MAG TPA: amidohydrolase family protein [Methylomirabilota bacterium]|nr:amidohydrolase family protein [Methylomirabilota bacterium]
MRPFALLGLSGLIAVLAGSTPSSAQSVDLPLTDGHIHYSRPDWGVYPPERVLAILEKAGIRRALVSSTPDDGTLALHAKDAKRIVPILRPYRTRDDMATWWRDPSILPYLEERLKRGVHRGIGEFHVSGRDIKTPVLKRIAELAVERGIYLHAHSDDAAVETLFEIEPRARIIWAHAGMSSGPSAVGAMMDRHANLWADLSYRYGDVAPGGTLDPQWKALLIRHADRFMLGSDTWTTSRWESVGSIAEEARRFLGQLPRDVAEKIAYRNIERLFP